MNKTWKIVLIVLASLLTAAGLLAGGFLLGSARSLVANLVNARNEHPAPFAARQMDGDPQPGGMPGRRQRFDRMMQRADNDDLPRGRLGDSPRPNLEPMAMDQAREAVATFLASMQNDQLEIGTVIVFEHHAYAAIMESGSGAFEVTVQPNREIVLIQPNPWNLKYSPQSLGRGGAPGAGVLLNPESIPEMTVSLQQALAFAQTYLDKYLPDAELNAEPISFPGYYTILASTDGKISAILRVNGFTGQTFAARTRGTFIEMSE